MIITDEFIMINFPKTGSTFVRNVMKELYSNTNYLDKQLIKFKLKNEKRLINLQLPNIRVNSKAYGLKDEHGLFFQIPNEYKDREIVSVSRNLFERYISAYEYGNWKKHPWVDEEVLKNRYKTYPELSFKQYMDLVHFFNPYNSNPRINNKLNIGHATCQFILYYFKEPFKILNSINSNYIDSNRYLNDMAKITFLKQDNLNTDLYNFLISKGYNRKKTAFILKKGKENNSTPKGKKISDYFDKNLLNQTKERDKLLFNIFGEYAV